MTSNFIGTSTKYYLIKQAEGTEMVCQVDQYNGSTYWVTAFDRGTAYEDLDQVKSLKQIQQMMSQWMGKTDVFFIIKELNERTEVVDEA